MAETATYYFNSYDEGGEEWATNPENMVDGDTGNSSSTNDDADVELLLTNTCDGTNLGTISVVEVRCYCQISGGGPSRIDLVPVFGGSDDGDTHIIAPGFSGAWSSYVDITDDTNAPEDWDWDDVKDLDIDMGVEINASAVLCSRVEVRVTYTPGGADPVYRKIMTTNSLFW